ncbi:unnamed protein product [Rotaria sordida]|uniref:ADP ribosyltransferase domain-containing protein n=1 Tax=Rotaria sordida TaxID=392033 RepID=A0A816AYS8_9BILA|nr:unnamed protein product [Rotaria sordida]CAF1601521.1 unnamed protein product [Rotaria sordida]
MAEAVESINRRRNNYEFNHSLIERLRQSQNNLKLIWFDPNIRSKEDMKTKKEELRVINEHVNIFSDLDECIKFIKSVKNEKIFLITSGTQAPEILSQVSDLSQVDSIFIFCMLKDRHEYLLTKYNKIVGIYTEFDDLCKTIEDEFDFFNKRIETFSSFEKGEQSTKDLSKESSTFLWYQIFNYIITRLPRNQQAKEQMIQLCKDYYCRNREEMKNIVEFEQTYRSENAIYWYSKKSFLYKIVNKVLRTESIELIHAFRVFICDLSENLQCQHKKIFLSKEKILHLYRGAALDIKEFNRLKQSQGKLISTNGYLSTSREESQARAYANKSSKRNDIIRVLFHIEINIEKIDKNIIFADITELSDNPKEAEVLFDINACFEIKSFQEDKSFQIINMKLSNEGPKIAKDFLESTRKEIEGTSDSIIVGRLLCDLGEYDESQKYFEQLLDKSNNEDRPWIEFNIGRALDFKGQWKEAEKYYNCAYNLMMEDGSKRLKDAAHVLNSMGNVLHRHKKDDEALGCHQKALKIQEKYYPSNQADIATSLNNIGKILTRQEKHTEALEYYQQASTIYEKLYPSGHANLADTLNNIGVSHENQNNQKMALDYFERALTLNVKFRPLDHENLKKTKDAIRRLPATK